MKSRAISKRPHRGFPFLVLTIVCLPWLQLLVAQFTGRCWHLPCCRVFLGCQEDWDWNWLLLYGISTSWLCLCTFFSCCVQVCLTNENWNYWMLKISYTTHIAYSCNVKSLCMSWEQFVINPHLFSNLGAEWKFSCIRRRINMTWLNLVCSIGSFHLMRRYYEQC